MYAAIRQVNLDPHPAFLHVPDYGRHSLVMDLMEEFRVIIADTLCLSLFNLKILQQNDFRLEYPPSPKDDQLGEPGKTADITTDSYGHMADLDCREHFDLPVQRMEDEPCVDFDAEFGAGKPAVKLNDDAFRRVIENFERKIRH
jgi:CRISPR-associated protein Cas1